MATGQQKISSDRNRLSGKKEDTARTHAELAMQRQAEMLRLSFDAIFVWRIDGGIESWNRGAEQLYGYSENEALGRVTHELLRTTHSTPWPEIEARLRQCGTWEGELRHITKQGRAVTVASRHQLIAGADGVELILETNRDITESKHAAETSARLAAIVQFSDDAIISKDLNGVISSWNPSAERIFGYSAEEIIGQPITLIIPPDRHAEEAAFLEGLRRGEHINHYETVRLRKDGRRIDVSVSISPVFNASGTLFAISKIVRDITDSKQAEQALIRSEKLASVGRMAATIAHEINNPLASAINALYLVRTDPALPECVKSNLALAEQELNRVSHITKQTLGFYKEIGNPTAVDLPGVLDSLLDLYGPRLRNKKISVQRSYRSSMGIRANEGEIRQVISNVIANSIDALPEGGKLHVRLCGPQTLSGHRRMVRLTIADNGEGIARANLKRIFEPFFTTKQAIGTGLGLWVVSELVKKHEGRLRLRSRLGKGTVLTLWLPMERRNWAQRRSA